jgi:2,7-dihydroxy-5-methyl-1-naphthoate 7-O-methyltransferase
VPTNIDQLLTMADLCTPWCIRVAATLRIADHLADSPLDIADLAGAVGSDADCLGRVMRHLVRYGIFSEIAPGLFANNNLSEALLEPPALLRLSLDAIGGRYAVAWATLLEAVCSGLPRYHDVFGKSFWADLADNPQMAVSFDAHMGPAGKGRADPDVLLADDWDTVHTVVDVGGGTGALLAEILRVRPHISGTLVDLPRTVAQSTDIFAENSLSGRVRVIGQSFFEPLPRGADLYLLHGILNDWRDEDAIRILRGCADAAAPSGRVVILDGIVPETGVAPETGAGDLLMMILFGAKYRTAAELGDLAGKAGLAVSAAGRNQSGRFAVECHPSADVARDFPVRGQSA